MHYYVKKLRQNVGLETWKWRQIVTSQTANTKYKWTPFDPEPKPPHENFLRTPLKSQVPKETLMEQGSEVVLKRPAIWLHRISCDTNAWSVTPCHLHEDGHSLTGRCNLRRSISEAVCESPPPSSPLMRRLSSKTECFYSQSLVRTQR